jgi:hypothetical protein
VSGVVTPLERRCRCLLRAWPWRDRAERGEELLGTMLDVTDDDRSWPSPVMAADMVVAGIRARRRRRPPWTVRVQLSTRARLDHRWHEWMLDRLLAPGWRRRIATANARVATCILLVQVMIRLPYARPVPPLVVPVMVGMVAFVSAGGFLFAGSDRARILRRNGYVLEGSPPRLVSRLVWTEQGERIANVRLAPVMAAISLPMFLAGRGLVVSVHETTGRLLHQPLVISLTFALFLLAYGWTSVHHIAAGAPGRPTVWAGRRSLPAAAVVIGVEVVVLLVAPMGAPGLAGGALGLLPAMATFVLLLEERRIGRSVGLWDVVPRLAPGPVVRIGPPSLPSWPDRSQSWDAHPPGGSP